MKKLRILSTGIHLDKFKKGEKGLIKKEFHLGKSFTILFVGMLTERKGVDIFIKVVGRLLDEGHDVKGLIVGDGSEREEFESMTKHCWPPYDKLYWGDYITFTGGRKDVLNFYKDADVLLLPSMGEGLPGVVMEAMASGLPCIATDEGCTPDLIENGKDGFLVKPFDVEGYYQAVKQVMNEDLQYRFAQSSLAKMKDFSWEKAAARYEDLYKE